MNSKWALWAGAIAAGTLIPAAGLQAKDAEPTVARLQAKVAAYQTAQISVDRLPGPIGRVEIFAGSEKVGEFDARPGEPTVSYCQIGRYATSTYDFSDSRLKVTVENARGVQTAFTVKVYGVDRTARATREDKVASRP